MRNQWVLVGILASSLVAAPSLALAQHKAPNQQPGTDAAPTVPTGELVLGTVHLTKATTADGKPLPAGVYQVKLTAQEAKPDAKGASENIERWVEFSQKGAVKGREVVSIVPQNEVKNVVKDPPPAPGGAPKVQMLKGNDYLRVWFNKGGNHYLIYFPATAAS
jgi:hypothetical protein